MGRDGDPRREAEGDPDAQLVGIRPVPSALVARGVPLSLPLGGGQAWRGGRLRLPGQPLRSYGLSDLERQDGLVLVVEGAEGARGGEDPARLCFHQALLRQLSLIVLLYSNNKGARCNLVAKCDSSQAILLHLLINS